jgi:oxygen-independent coproporphyrinogen-3 oxidase
MTVMTGNNLEIYIHIPFCVRKCLYCDFLSAPAADETKDAYIHALFTEIEERADEYRDYTVSSVFIGGGTPSTVKPEQIKQLMELLYDKFSMEPDAEITIETNPGTVDYAALKIYRSVGINRLSIGLQSASDDELKALGRIHCYEDFTKAYDEAVNAGFTNINVDVMSDIPGQDIESYIDTLKKVTALNPPPKHISAYSLIVEEGTPFYELQSLGKLNIADEDTDRLMYAKTGELLAKAGYERYEISNYAKDGYRCRHNCGYWRRVPYIGFGIGAASLFKGMRFSNASDISVYIDNPSGCRCDEILLTDEDCMEEFMFLGLRMTEGVSGDEFERCFGKSMDSVYGQVIRKNIEAGLLTETGTDLKRIALTEKGMDVSNYVMAQFLF